MKESFTDTDILNMLLDPMQKEKGFRLLMKTYGKALYWHIRRIVVSKEDAEDALQEASIKIFRSIGSFRGESKITSWIYRICTNEAIQVLRNKGGFFQSLDSLGPKLVRTLEQETDLPADAVEVVFQKALLSLPAQQRIVFNMRYYDELSYEEIAEITGKKVGALKANYHYAQQKVRKCLQENF